MLTVDDYGAIRRARRDGKSIRQIARDFNHSRNTIRLILQHPEPNPSPRNYSAPVLGSFQALIDQILVDDEDAPPKQRHTAMQVFRRLRDEHGYPGCYGQVQRYLLKHQHKHKETFIPLGHLPGQRLEADFGHIHVDFPDGRRQIPFLVTTAQGGAFRHPRSGRRPCSHLHPQGRCTGGCRKALPSATLRTGG